MEQSHSEVPTHIENEPTAPTRMSDESRLFQRANETETVSDGDESRLSGSKRLFLKAFPRLGRVLSNTSKISDARAMVRVFGDIQENFAVEKTPETVEYIGDTTAIAEKLFSRDKRKELVDKATQKLAIGESCGVIVIAGNKETCTSHPHIFEIIRNSEDISLLFVDPEDTVGRNHFLRPRIAEVLEIKIKTGEDESYAMDFAINRFRTNTFNPEQLKLVPLYAQAKELIAKKGKVDLLSGKEQETLFRLFFDQRQGVFQGRNMSAEDTQRLFSEGKGSRMVEGKIYSNINRVAQFVKLFSNPEEFKATFFQDQEKAVRNFEGIKHKLKST